MCRQVERYSDDEVLKFCQAYVDAGKGATYSGAYRQAFPDDSKDLSASSIHKRASKLYNSERCQNTLNLIRQPVIENTGYTLERFASRMINLSESAEMAGEYSAAISAEVHAAKALGIYTEKQKVELNGSLTVASIFEELNKRKRGTQDE